MKTALKFLKIGGFIAGIIILFAALSFTKLLLNENNNNAKSSTSPVSGVENDNQSSNYLMASQKQEDVDLENPPGVRDISEIKPGEIKADKNKEQLYHKTMAEFCENTLKPIGFYLASDEYITGDKNTIVLYFERDENVDNSKKELAAIEISRFVYGSFEDSTGFKTDYLKVHLKLPEGDSFSLDRQSYEKWVISGESSKVLFNSYMQNAFESDIGEPKQIENPLPANSIDKEQIPQKELYHKVMAEYCDTSLKPVGFVLSSDEYTAGDKNIILLRFDSTANMSYAAKEWAARKICQYVFGSFQEAAGFKTDYLKVHLKLPEGDSFALDRKDYEKWRNSHESDQVLFDKYINSTFKNEESSQVRDPKALDPQALQQYLGKLMSDGNSYRVEGESIVDAGIYIYIDKERSELSLAQLEDIIVKLSQEVLRNYYKSTGQRVGAFKLIDKKSDTLFVVYRSNIDILWTEGEDDSRFRDFIRRDGLGPSLE
ncbi:MAG: hypothetical protein ACOYWZ_03310 [Bacillota bacterium]